MRPLYDETVSSTDPVFSEAFRPGAGSVSSSLVVYSASVELDVTVEVDMGADVGWVPYIVGETAPAGQALVIVVDVPLPQRVRLVPASGGSTRVRVLAASAGGG